METPLTKLIFVICSLRIDYSIQGTGYTGKSGNDNGTKAKACEIE